jgi:2-aminoadipate transaminase
MEPVIEGVASDEQGVDVAALEQQLGAAADHPDSPERRRLLTLDLDPAVSPQGAPRFLYVLPNFQNPTGRSMGAARRQQLVETAARLGLPIVEDNPLW